LYHTYRPGYGLLACDESTGTVGSRLESIGVENTFENRATWRNLLFTAPNLNKYISGCILYEETLFQDEPKEGGEIGRGAKEGRSQATAKSACYLPTRITNNHMFVASPLALLFASLIAVAFVDKLQKEGIVPGIKVDMGLKALTGGGPKETWCSGLDGLFERATDYYKQGARFAKWR